MDQATLDQMAQMFKLMPKRDLDKIQRMAKQELDSRKPPRTVRPHQPHGTLTTRTGNNG